MRLSLTKNESLDTLVAINSIFVLAANMFPSIFALFVKEVGGSVLSAGSIWAIFCIATGLITFIISRYGDRLQETEYLVAAGYICRIIAWSGYFFANALWQLYFLQLILALGEALGTPAFNAIYSQHLNTGNYVRQWGLNNSLTAIVTGIAAFGGGFIAFHFGFKLLFLVMIVLSAVSFISLMQQPRKLL